MNIDDELGPLLHAMCFESLENPDFEYKSWIKEIKAIFPVHGVCKDCGSYDHCELPHGMGYLMSNFDENKDYCSKFWSEKESE